MRRERSRGDDRDRTLELIGGQAVRELHWRDRLSGLAQLVRRDPRRRRQRWAPERRRAQCGRSTLEELSRHKLLVEGPPVGQVRLRSCTHRHFMSGWRVLPDLRRVRLEREPQSDQVRLGKREVLLATGVATDTEDGVETHQDEEHCAVVRELDDGRLVEWVVGWADVLVVTCPAVLVGMLSCWKRTARACELELYRSKGASVRRLFRRIATDVLNRRSRKIVSESERQRRP